MLQDISEIRALTPHARDGHIGKIDDMYFTDEDWTVRYLVMDTGGWLTGRKVLITPRAVEALDIGRSELKLDLTREQIKDSPDYDTDKPVSRQYETRYYGYYGYPYYWTGPYVWGASAYPLPPASPAGSPRTYSWDELHARMERKRNEGDPHLRSAKEVMGYRIEATDGEIGHVETFLFDDAMWRIRALVIDTKNWWPGKHVIVAPRHVESIDWGERHVRVDLTRERVKASAEYEPAVYTASRREERVREIEHALHFGD